MAFELGDRVYIGKSKHHDEFTRPAVGRWGEVTCDPEGISLYGMDVMWVEVTFEGDPIDGENRYYFPSDSLHHNAPDTVNHPKHYSSGLPEGIQVVDIIRAQGADFFHGNVIKYILRWKFKNGVEDLKKAQVYLGWLIEQEEAKNV